MFKSTSCGESPPSVQVTDMYAPLDFRPNQALRAQAYGEYLDSALKHPQVVGTHWHQYMDQPTSGRFDGENFNVGLFTICDMPYPEMRAAVRHAGYNMYKTRFGGK